MSRSIQIGDHVIINSDDQTKEYTIKSIQSKTILIQDIITNQTNTLIYQSGKWNLPDQMGDYQIDFISGTQNSNIRDIIILLVQVEGDTLYWLVKNLSQIESKILELEVNQYNKQAEWIAAGKAPTCVYDQEVANSYWLAYHQEDYQYVPGIKLPTAREYYESMSDGFEYIDLQDPTEDQVDIINEYKDGQLTFEHPNELRNVIEKKYEPAHEFSLGYRLLPLTEMLMIQNRFSHQN